MNQYALLSTFLTTLLLSLSDAFVNNPNNFFQRDLFCGLLSHKIDRNFFQDQKYAEAFRIIDECSISGQPCDDLYDSVRYIDRSASTLYPNLDAKKELWDRAHGSWKLQMATGGGRFKTFKPVPIFAYAMIDEKNFGNGIGFNQDNIVLSLLGPHYFNDKTRSMGIGIHDMFIFSKKVTHLLPSFIYDRIGLNKGPSDFTNRKGSRMPAFTMIGASEKSLIARGGSGGIAIWTRLDKDIRPAAYGAWRDAGKL
mmetsp:Transcript_25173/g.51916  ORF Transcript_25173/g.51916 Transcript_25173/m.51916 type:complete len:253 (-) Transcript_25173:77-835(-)